MSEGFLNALCCVAVFLLGPLSVWGYRRIAELALTRHITGSREVRLLRAFYRQDPAHRYLSLDDQRQRFFQWHGESPTECPKCGYDRRASKSDTCPECGWTTPIPRVHQ